MNVLKKGLVITVVLVVSILLICPAPGLLPLDETVELDPELKLSDNTAGLFEVSELVFTLESVTRRISILGWASERYELGIGRVLKGTLDEETANMYVFPYGFYSTQFASLTDGCGAIVFASPDSTGRCMEGLRTYDGNFFVYLHIGICPK